jgi:hypothetical protein
MNMMDHRIWAGLLFDDHNLGREVVALLEDYCNRSIAEIGSIDLSHTL